MTKPFILLILALLTLPATAQDSAIDPDKQAAIEELMRVTGALQVGEQFGQAMTQQMTTVLQQTCPDIHPRALVIVTKEVQVVMAAETASGSIENLFFPLYDKYFTLAEIQGLLDFYETEIGKKSIEVLLSLNKNLCKLDKLGDSTRAKDCAAYENGLKRIEIDLRN